MKLLEVHDLQVRFPGPTRGWGRGRRWVRAVDGVTLEVARGETVGLVGESGCGKTTLGRAVVGLVEPSGGSIRFEGEPVPARRGRGLRRRLQMIFQDPGGSLDPRWTAGDIVAEALDIHGLAPGIVARRERVAALLAQVGLDPLEAGRYPHEFSGGQRQRLGIARALAADPLLLVCDEPVSALDVSVQAQIVNLLLELQAARGLSYLFVAHDLAVVEAASHRLLVMYLGRIVECGPTRAICGTPLHPYTRALVAAVPRLPPVAGQPPLTLRAERPSLAAVPAGCPFHPRCPIAEERCRRETPVLREIGSGRAVACHLVPGVSGS
jgi:oligopeptide/dipeptide ABC transporter ATP-binding protein